MVVWRRMRSVKWQHDDSLSMVVARRDDNIKTASLERMPSDDGCTAVRQLRHLKMAHLSEKKDSATTTMTTVGRRLNVRRRRPKKKTKTKTAVVRDGSTSANSGTLAVHHRPVNFLQLPSGAPRQKNYYVVSLAAFGFSRLVDIHLSTSPSRVDEAPAWDASTNRAGNWRRLPSRRAAVKRCPTVSLCTSNAVLMFSSVTTTWKGCEGRDRQRWARDVLQYTSAKSCLCERTINQEDRWPILQ